MLTKDEIKNLIEAVEQGAGARVDNLGLDEAHTISFACGAMTVFAALGIWDSVPIQWHLYAQSGRDPFTGHPLPANPPDSWPVLRLTRGDLTSRGFDLSEVDETEMEIIAQEMGGNEHLLNAYWRVLVAVAEMQDLPRAEEEVDEGLDDSPVH